MTRGRLGSLFFSFPNGVNVHTLCRGRTLRQIVVGPPGETGDAVVNNGAMGIFAGSGEEVNILIFLDFFVVLLFVTVQ